MVLAAALIGLLASDTLLFDLPASLATRTQHRIAKRRRAQGLVALWTFDGLTVRDSVSGAPATAFGTVLTGGRHGQARAFAGTEREYIATGVPWSSLGDRYTISIWVKLRAGSPDQSIMVGRGRSPAGIMLAGGRMLLWVPFEGRRAASYVFEKYGRFVNVTGVVDAGRGKAWLYEDGELRDTVDIDGVEHLPAFIEFGKYQEHRVYFPLDGALDEAAVWARPLSPEEVREVARSRTSRAHAGIPLRHVAALHAIDGFSGFVDGVLKALDYFNPLYHETRIYESGLPTVDLHLSRSDLRYFRAARAERIATGQAGAATTKRRKVELIVGGQLHDAQMTLYGSDPVLWASPKPSFTVSAEGLGSVLGARRVAFVPPETRGVLRPLVQQRLAARYGLPRHRAGLAIVRINGEFSGLYLFQEQPVDGVPPDAVDFPAAVERLPVPGAELVEAYDAVRSEAEPLLVRDPTGSWSSRRVRHAIRKDRETLVRLATRSVARDARDDLVLVREYLNERRVLKGNPSPSYVLDDLDLDVARFPSVQVWWTSSRPEVIDRHGRVHRPEGSQPVTVTLEASIARGAVATTRALSFTVMPRTLTLPVLRLQAPGPILNTHRTPCLAELIEGAGSRRTAPLPCGIKLRGNTSLRDPKQSYSLQLPEDQRLLDFTGSRIVHLIASYADPSLMRNKLAYDVFRSFAGPGAPRDSPRVHLVEVTLNDEYRGVYQLSERVDRFLLGFDRFRKEDPVPSVIYKAQGAAADFDRFARHAYVQVEPPAERGAYWTPLEKLVLFVGSAEPERFRREIHRWIDVPEYIDFHILVNLFNNREGIRYNLFLARGNDERRPFVIVPWDYDRSLTWPADGWLSNALFQRLWRDVPEFRVQLKNRWNQLRQRQLAGSTLMGMIDAIDAGLGDAARREFARWPREDTHEANVNRLKSWLQDRLRFLDQLANAA